MNNLILRWLIAAGALYGTVWFLHLLHLADLEKGPWYGWFLAGIIMGLVNALIRPVVGLLTAPLNCMTFGLVGIVVNALMFALVPAIAAALGTPIFALKWPWGPLLGSILVGLLSGAAGKLLIREDDDRD